MRRVLLGVLVVLLVAAGSPTVDAATNPDEILADPALEQRARGLTKQLRCLVCQNQSIDDSAAPLARDLRLLVRERLTKGDSDSQVLNYLVARYGEFVLLKPRFELQNLLLWGLPPFALVAGMIALVVTARRRRTADLQVPALSASEQKRVATLVEPQPD